MKRIEWIEKYINEAEQLVYDNEVEKAVSIMEELLYDEPGYGSLHNVLGWAHVYYTHDVKKAEGYLLHAIKFEPDFAPPHLHLGNLYIRQNRYTEALAILEGGIHKSEAHKVTFMETIGQVHELQKKYRKAIQFYKHALAGTASNEAYRFTDSIKRCRKKQLVLMFTF